MNRNKFRFSTIFITFTILVGIDFFGLFSLRADGIIGALNTFDVVLVLINLYFFHLLVYNVTMKSLFKGKGLIFIKGLYFIALITIISMPFRGSISIIDAARVARPYLIIPLAFLISLDIINHDKQKYYINLFLFISVVASIQIIVNSFNPALLQAYFPDVVASEGYKYDFHRNYFRSNTMIFPAIATIYLFTYIIVNNFKRNYLILLLLTFLGAALQGFRSYFLVLLLILFLITFTQFRMKKIFSFVIAGGFILTLSTYLDNEFLDQQIFGKIYTSYIEVFERQAGTLERRQLNDAIFILPYLKEKPIFGWGYIYYGSTYGKQLGIREGGVKAYSIYSVDSGYLTMLIKYGYAGTVFLLILTFYTIYYLLKKPKRDKTMYITNMGVILLIAITIYTHGALFSLFGLLPTSIFAGLLAVEEYKSKKPRVI